MGLANALCFHLARKQILTRQREVTHNTLSSAATEKRQAVADPAAYQHWRDKELRATFSRYFTPADVKDCDVVDFGCGDGGLSFMLSTLGAKSITGIDLSEAGIRAAQQRVQQSHGPVTPTFILTHSVTTVELPSASADVLVCFDVLEHIMNYKIVIPEWKRVLRKNGRVLIAWTPWYNPYAHHLENMVPLPWAHVFFSEKTLIQTCQRIYDMPDWDPPSWDIDTNGHKKPNRWKNLFQLSDLNRLTMHQFEAECRGAGFAIARKQVSGFGSAPIARLTHVLLQVPRVQEFFTSMVGYTLQKPHA